MRRRCCFLITAVGAFLMRAVLPLCRYPCVTSFRPTARYGSKNTYPPTCATAFSKTFFTVYLTKENDIDENIDRSLAKNAFDVLARRSKSWQRLKSFVDFALDNEYNQHGNKTLQSVCDVGTDHGLLATALSMTNRFDSVLGVDVSKQAIEYGALKLYDEIVTFRSKNRVDDIPKKLMNVHFRLSNGLNNVSKGEADIVCIAGMGVNTMIDILTTRKNVSVQSLQPILILDSLETQLLLLQPTSSRPRYLIHLYRKLQDIGWCVRAERVELVSSRWYFTIAFHRSNKCSIQIPGTFFNLSNRPAMEAELANWIQHHKKWIQIDSTKKESPHIDDELWLEEIERVNSKFLEE